MNKNINKIQTRTKYIYKAMNTYFKINVTTNSMCKALIMVVLFPKYVLVKVYKQAP